MATVFFASAVKYNGHSNSDGENMPHHVYLLYRDCPPPLALEIIERLVRGNLRGSLEDISSCQLPAGASDISLIGVKTSIVLHCGEAHFKAVKYTLLYSATVLWLATNDMVNR